MIPNIQIEKTGASRIVSQLALIDRAAVVGLVLTVETTARSIIRSERFPQTLRSTINESIQLNRNGNPALVDRSWIWSWIYDGIQAQNSEEDISC